MKGCETSAYLNQCADALRAVPPATIDAIAAEFQRARNGGGTIYFLGNGACASLADHMAADFGKQDLNAAGGAPTRSLRTHSLVGNAALVTAVGNDIGFDEVFALQMRGRLAQQDVVVALSASGSSINVLRAVDEAEAVGATVIGFTGAMEPHPPLQLRSDISLQVPSDQIDQIENVHVAAHHAILRSYLRLVQQ